MTKQFQKDLPSSDLKSVLAEGKRLKDLTPTTKDWIRGRLLEDTSVKPTTKIEKAADSMTKTGGGLIDWAKKNPVQAALLIVPGAVGFRLASKAGTFIAKKYGSKAVNKVKEVVKKKGFNNPEVRKRYARMFPQKKNKPDESVISKTVKKTDKQTPPIQKNGVDKLKLAKQKVNNSKQIKNSNLSFDDKRNVINQIAKDDNKTLTTAFTQVLRKKNSKLVGKESVKEARKQAKSVINKPKVDKVKPVKADKKIVKADKKIVKVDKKPVKVDKKPVKVDKKPVKADKKPIVSKDTQILLTRKLVKDFKNNSNSITKQINSSNMDSLNKKRLINTLQDTVNFLQKNKGSTIGEALKGAGIKNPLKILKKGGLIKRNMGGNLKQPPAGNKGLRKLPTPVRNKMGFAKRGGVVKKNTGGFLGAGKALRGQGAVMRKRGGKIGY